MTGTVVKWEHLRVSLSVGPGFLLLKDHNKKFGPREARHNIFFERTVRLNRDRVGKKAAKMSDGSVRYKMVDFPGLGQGTADFC